ncbi:MAG: flagellar biosynthesis protein FliQ [Phycisphaerales bacterium]
MYDGSIDLVRDALLEGLLLALPILLAGLVIGLLISVFQAVTQIQEQTLSFVPKIAVMILVGILLLGWITMRLSAFASRMFEFHVESVG